MPNRSGSHGDGQNRGNREKQDPLKWNRVKEFTRGCVVAHVDHAQGNNGTIVSYRFSKTVKERSSQFFRPGDLDDLAQVVEDVRAFRDNNPPTI